MNVYALLAFSLGIGLLSGILLNLFAKKDMVTGGDCFSFTLQRTVFSCILLFILSIFSGPLSLPSLYTAVWGSLYGLATCASIVFNTYALSVGGYGITSLFCSLQMLIPAFSGFLFWNESISVGQYIGMVLLFCGLFLCLWQKSEKKFSFKWMAFCFGNILSTGAIGIIQKIHQNSVYKQELPAFLIVSFLISIVFLLLVLLLVQRKPEMRISSKWSIRLGVIAAVVGLCTALNHFINTDLVGRMSSIVIFPVYNGTSLLLTLLASVLLFREKFKLRQILGFFVGLIGILLIGNLLSLLL